jgi:undecaprenyl diphosphate synthase
LDGNRRWAKARNLPSFVGHRCGYEKVKEITRLLVKYGIKYVTYYMFSTENWNRSKEEVSYLMDLFRDLFDEANDFFEKSKIRVLCIGNLEKIPKDILEKLKNLKEETKNNTVLTVTVAISYSGKDEIVRAAKKITHDVNSGVINANDLDENTFSRYLDTHGTPNPDAVVRTKEKRISNFLIWQIAYSEIFFVDKFWPDFSENDLKNVIEEFSKRDRRYGR